ncbi:unnamed protein product [Meganyctiphanes norvegica]|uniref:Fibronectin type-III domain-containing protein n=1 Tax=Meganyctiphanes norvegica TaxID=48144 RepID=A0AAV2PTI1_MEGNR
MLIRLSLFAVIITTLDLTQGLENNVKGNLLHISKIREDDFQLYWYSADYGTTQNYTVTLHEKIDGCNATEYHIHCKTDSCGFSLSEYCQTLPCTDIIVMVGGNDIYSEQIKFNTAPSITELQNIKLQVNGSIAEVIWNSEKNNPESICATKARIKMKVNGITNGKPEIVDTELDQENNNISIELDPCDTGPVDAYITYVTILEEYDTSATDHERADNDFTGVGIEEPPETSGGDISCSIQASWHSVCDKVDDYFLTWDDGEIDEISNLNDTSYIIHGLKAGNCTVCVSANYENALIGEKLCSVVYVEKVTPEATKVDKLGLENDSSNELTVQWTGPDTKSCKVVDGFHITWQKDGEDSIIGSWNVSSEDTQYTITGLTECTLYEVKVQAFSDIGEGPAGSMSGGTGATTEAPVVTINNATSSTLYIKWDYDSPEECKLSQFIIKWKSTNSSDETHEVNSDEIDYTIQDLICNTDYTITVIAKLAGDLPIDSEPVVGLTNDEVPEQIQNVTVSADKIEPTHLSVSWSEAPYHCLGSLQGYKLSWEVDGKTYTNDTDASCNTYVITGLEQCTTYQVTVIGVSTAGEGPKKTKSGKTSGDCKTAETTTTTSKTSPPTTPTTGGAGNIFPQNVLVLSVIALFLGILPINW